jgi:hypothetical protein
MVCIFQGFPYDIPAWPNLLAGLSKLALLCITYFVLLVFTVELRD